MTVDIHDQLSSYGVRFEGDMTPPDFSGEWEHLPLAEVVARGGRITRVRWIGGDYIPGRGRCYDLSYVHAVLQDGTKVRVSHAPAAFLVPRRNLKGEMIAWAKDEGVYAKGCGLLDDSNYSILG